MIRQIIARLPSAKIQTRKLQQPGVQERKCRFLGFIFSLAGINRSYKIDSMLIGIGKSEGMMPEMSARRQEKSSAWVKRLVTARVWSAVA
jgi:hypothetical protein